MAPILSSEAERPSKSARGFDACWRLPERPPPGNDDQGSRQGRKRPPASRAGALLSPQHIENARNGLGLRRARPPRRRPSRSSPATGFAAHKFRRKALKTLKMDSGQAGAARRAADWRVQAPAEGLAADDFRQNTLKTPKTDSRVSGTDASRLRLPYSRPGKRLGGARILPQFIENAQDGLGRVQARASLCRLPNSSPCERFGGPRFSPQHVDNAENGLARVQSRPSGRRLQVQAHARRLSAREFCRKPLKTLKTDSVGPAAARRAQGFRTPRRPSTARPDAPR